MLKKIKSKKKIGKYDRSRFNISVCLDTDTIKKKIPHTNIFTFYRDQALLGGPKCSSQPLAHLFYLQPKYEHKEFQVSCYLLAVRG